MLLRTTPDYSQMHTLASTFSALHVSRSCRAVSLSSSSAQSSSSSEKSSRRSMDVLLPLLPFACHSKCADLNDTLPERGRTSADFGL